MCIIIYYLKYIVLFGKIIIPLYGVEVILRHNKLFIIFVCAELFAAFSSGMDISVYNFWLFSLTKSVVVISVASSIVMAGPFLWGWLVGRFADRVNPFLQLATIYFLLASMSLVPVFITTSRYLSIIYSALAVVGFCGAVGNSLWPVLSARILKPEEYGKAEGILGVLNNIRLLIGTAAGGTLYSVIGARHSFMLESSIFFSATIVIILAFIFYKHMRVLQLTVTEKIEQETPTQSITAWMLSNSWLKRALLIGVLAQIAFAAMNTLWVPFVEILYQGNDFLIGITYMVQGVGGVLGGFCAVRWFSKNPQLHRVRWMYAFFAINILIYTTFPLMSLLLTLIFLEGIVMEWGRMPLQLIWLNIPPASIRGLIFSKKQSVISITGLLSSLLSGVIAAHSGIRLTFYGMAILLVITMLYAWTFKGNPSRATEGQSDNLNVLCL